MYICQDNCEVKFSKRKKTRTWSLLQFVDILGSYNKSYVKTSCERDHIFHVLLRWKKWTSLLTFKIMSTKIVYKMYCSGTFLTQHLWGHMFQFVLSGAFDTQNNTGDLKNHFVLSGVMC